MDPTGGVSDHSAIRRKANKIVLEKLVKIMPFLSQVANVINPFKDFMDTP